MKNLIIKLNHEMTEKYQTMATKKAQAEMENDMEASGVSLDIEISMFAGMTFLEALKVDGHHIKIADDGFKAVEVTVTDEINKNQQEPT